MNLKHHLHTVYAVLKQNDRIRRAYTEFESKRIQKIMETEFAKMLMKHIPCATCKTCIRKCGLSRQLRNLSQGSHCQYKIA